MVVYENKELIDKNFNNQNLQGSTFNNVTLTNCSFDNTNLKNCVFTSTNLKNSGFLNNTLTDLKSSNISIKEISQLGDDIDGEAAEDQSGLYNNSVSLSYDGKRLAVGADSNDGNGVLAGHVRVFEWNSLTETWQQLGDDIDAEIARDRNGFSVSLSEDGTYLAIGAIWNDGTGNSAGHVRVFEWNSLTETWQQLGDDIDAEAEADIFGYSVSLSKNGTRLAVGAPLNDGTATSAGHVRVFEWKSLTETWQQLGDDIDGEAASDFSGLNVSLSGDGTRVAVGAYANDGNGDAAGHVRVYEWKSLTETWQQLGDDIDGEAEGDESGYSVSLSEDGTRVAVGAYLNDGTATSAGHVRVYEWKSLTETWEQLGDDIDGEEYVDQSGFSVSLNKDGTRLAVGANLNDAEFTENLTDNRGSVRVYQWSGNSWFQIGRDIDGEAAGDESGRSISLSRDGTRLAVGAPYNDGTATNAGHVRVYDVDIFYSNTFSVIGGHMVGPGVDMSNLQLENLDFRGTNLSNVNFTKTTFKNVQFIKNDFTNTTFSRNTFEDCVIVNPVNLTSLVLPVNGISEVIAMNAQNSGSVFDIERNVSIFDDKYDKNYSNNQTYYNIFQNNRLIQMSGSIKTESDGDFVGIFKGVHENITYSDNKFLSNEAEIPSDDIIYYGSGEYTLAETYLTGPFTIAFYTDPGVNQTGFDIKVKTSFDIEGDLTSFLNSLNLTSDVLISSDLISDTFITKPDTQVILSSVTPTYTPNLEEAVFVILDIDGSSITFNLPEEVTIKIVRDSSTQYSVFKNEETTASFIQTTGDIGIEGDFEWKIGSVLAQLNVPFGVICFGQDEMVETDQGIVPIHQVRVNEHTIRDLPVEEKSHIRCLDEKVVLIEKDALGKNYPNKDTIVSLNHQILVDNKYIRARKIRREGVSRIDSNNRELYNIMLPRYTHMKVNNMVVETLHPSRRLR